MRHADVVALVVAWQARQVGAAAVCLALAFLEETRPAVLVEGWVRRDE